MGSLQQPYPPRKAGTSPVRLQERNPEPCPDCGAEAVERKEPADSPYRSIAICPACVAVVSRNPLRDLGRRDLESMSMLRGWLGAVARGDEKEADRLQLQLRQRGLDLRRVGRDSDQAGTKIRDFADACRRRREALAGLGRHGLRSAAEVGPTAEEAGR